MKSPVLTANTTVLFKSLYFLNVGVRKTNSENRNKKILTTNFVCAFYGSLALPFVFITYALIPGLVYLPIVFFFTSISGIFFNYVLMPGVARFIICIPLLLVFDSYLSFITPDFEQPISGFLAMHCLALINPFILFDLEEEKLSLIFYSVSTIFITVMLPTLNNICSLNLPEQTVEIFKTGWLFYVCVFIAIATIMGALLFGDVSSKQIEKKNRKLIIELSQKNEQILANENRLTKENYIRERLLSVVSHDIKSPLNALKGILNLYEDGYMSQSELKPFTEKITEDLNTTALLVDNVLLWASNQLKGVQVVYSIVDLHPLVEEHLRIFKSIAGNKHIALINEVPSIQVHSDKQIISLVLRNLIANAIKFSYENGKVKIGSQHDESGFTLTISDTGKGMPPHVAESLFNAESTVITEGTAREKGTGLGLSLCYDYLQYIRGKITAQGHPGKGTIFTVSIPLVTQVETSLTC